MQFARLIASAILLLPNGLAFQTIDHHRRFLRQSSLLSTGGLGQNGGATSSSLTSAILHRKSCKQFQRFDGRDGQQTTDASPADPQIVMLAKQCLDLSRRTPSSFNTQPYKVCLVRDVEQKAALARHCLGPNKARVRDGDCTVVFLADRQVMRTFSKYTDMLEKHYGKQDRKNLLRTLFYISIFSSGYPLPRILASPLSFLARLCFSFVNLFTRKFYPMPSLANAETWASKQCLMVAMTFLLSCTSLHLATAPMEGFNAGGIRRVLRIPARYSIPLIITVGKPISPPSATADPLAANDRYSLEDILYDGSFGTAFAT